jgi:hypothetical protein
MFVYFIVWSKHLKLIFKVRDQGYHFGYRLNLTFKDVNKYYGLWRMSLGNV